MTGAQAFMLNWRKALGATIAVALVSSMALVAQKKDDKKQNEAQRREIQGVVKVVDDMSNGQSSANDFDLTWLHLDFMKAQNNKQYVPFTVSIDPSKTNAGTLTLYWRVVAKNAPVAAPEAKAE